MVNHLLVNINYMATLITNTLKQKGSGTFPLMNAEDISLHSTSNIEKEIKPATDSTTGRIKIGDNIKNDNGKLSLDKFLTVSKEEPTDNSLLWIGDNRKEDANEIFSYYGEFVLNINGENETSFVSISKTKLDEIDLHKVVEKYIKEAYDNFKAESVKTSKYNIIINPESMGKILRTFSNMFSKELIDKNLSLLTGKVNTQVFNEKINIVEDPTNEHLVGKRLFDNEGVTTYYKDIVVNGKFITPLYNIKSAKKDNKKSTGNSFGVRNMYIKPGNISEENLLLMLNNGIYIKDLEGLHAGVDTISGNISLQATGYLVEDGIKTKALKMIILSTDLLELLNNVVEVASNLEFYNPLCGSPSILFKDITIAGKC